MQVLEGIANGSDGIDMMKCFRGRGNEGMSDGVIEALKW